MALPSSGQIHMGALADNNSSASRANISMKTEAERFAGGSRVGDIDGNPADLGDADDRTALNSAPYALSEFYGANFPSSIITGITFTTDGSDSNTVDGEDLDVAFTTDGTSGTYTVRLLDSGENTDASTTRSGAGSVTFSNLALDDGDGYKVQVQFDTYNIVNDNATFNHHDALGSISIGDPGTVTVASSTTVYAIDHSRSITNSNAVNDYNWTFAKSSGDSSGLRLSGEGSYGSSVTTVASTPAIQYKGPGVFTANLRIDGRPSQARNSSTAAEVSHRIDYTKQITIDNPSSVNKGTSYNITGNHKGYSSGIEVDEILASNSSVLSSNDASGDSRIVSTNGDYSRSITPSTSGGSSTISVKAKGHGGGVSTESSAYNIYPLVSDYLGASDLTFGASAVTVGQNVTLDVGNDVTDNIVGYAWSNQGTGNMTVASGNASAGDTDGSANDSVSIIDLTDQSHPTVNFDTAQENKTIRLTLYGRLNQTATADKTINIELVDAITINNQSANFNDGDSVTISGNQSGLSGGVTFGIIEDGDNTMDVSTPNSRNDITNSKFTLDSYTGAFTLPTSLNQATHAGRVIDPNDGGAQNKNSSTWTTYPRLLDTRNTINDGGVSTIYSSTNISTTAFDNDSTSYANSISYGTPGSATNNIQSHQYSANTTPSEHSFGTATSQTTTFGGGTGVHTGITITYQVTGTTKAGPGQTQQTQDTLAVLYKPCIISISHTGGTIIVNDTEVVVSAISWQGFSDATGLQLSIRNSIGGIVGSNTTVNYANTEGGTTTSVSKTGLNINLGDSSSAGTMYIRVAKINDTAAYRQFPFTVSDYTTISIYGVGKGFSTPEHALVAKQAGVYENWQTTNKKLLPGISYGDGADLYDDNEGTRFNGGTYYHGYKPGATTDYFSVNTNGDINTIYSGDAEVPPRDPSGAGNSATQTSIAVSNYSVSNYTFAASGTTTATFDSKVTTKTVTVTWSDNSNIENGYKVYQNNSGGSLKGTAAEDATSKAITGITGDITFAVYAIGNSNGDESIHSLNASSTSYTHTNDGTLYLQATNNSGGATTDIDTATGTGSGTQTITWDKDELNPGVYTIRLRSGGYTGTEVAIDSSVTVTGDFATWSAEMFTETNGNGDTDTSLEVTIDVFSAGGTVALAIVDTTGQGGEMNIIYRIKAGSGGTYTSYGNSPSVSVSAGTTTMYVQAHATQVKNANSSGVGAIKLTESTAGFDSPNVDVNWEGNIYDP